MAEGRLRELPYERLAMSEAEMPDGLEWYDRQMFLQLRMLYHQHKSGVIDRETASNEKLKLLKDYDFLKWQDDFTKDIAQMIMATDAARCEYRKNRTLENADALMLAFESVPVSIRKKVD